MCCLRWLFFNVVRINGSGWSQRSELRKVKRLSVFHKWRRSIREEGVKDFFYDSTLLKSVTLGREGSKIVPNCVMSFMDDPLITRFLYLNKIYRFTHQLHFWRSPSWWLWKFKRIEKKFAENWSCFVKTARKRDRLNYLTQFFVYLYLCT